VLIKNNQMIDVYEAIKISQATMHTIKQNLFWAFFYNVIAIPVAAIGMLSPMIGALSMAFSDVIVVGNSIRLKFRKL
ncbi:MAG: ATPase P, partial [Bacteroidota bacterium]